MDGAQRLANREASPFAAITLEVIMDYLVLNLGKESQLMNCRCEQSEKNPDFLVWVGGGGTADANHFARMKTYPGYSLT